MLANANNMDICDMDNDNSKANNKKDHQTGSGRDIHIPAKYEFHGLQF